MCYYLGISSILGEDEVLEMDGFGLFGGGPQGKGRRLCEGKEGMHLLDFGLGEELVLVLVHRCLLRFIYIIYKLSIIVPIITFRLRSMISLDQPLPGSSPCHDRCRFPFLVYFPLWLILFPPSHMSIIGSSCWSADQVGWFFTILRLSIKDLSICDVRLKKRHLRPFEVINFNWSCERMMSNEELPESHHIQSIKRDAN